MDDRLKVYAIWLVALGVIGACFGIAGSAMFADESPYSLVNYYGDSNSDEWSQAAMRRNSSATSLLRAYHELSASGSSSSEGITGIPTVAIPDAGYENGAKNGRSAAAARRIAAVMSFQADTDEEVPPGQLRQPPIPGRDGGMDGPEEVPAKSNTPGDQKYGQEPKDTNQQYFLRSESVLLSPGESQFDTGLVYTLFDQNIPVGISTVSPPNLNGVVRGDFRRRLLYTPLGWRYGFTDRMQLYSYLPIGWANTQLSTTGSTRDTNSGGIGDLSFGGNYHLLKGGPDCADVIMTLGATAPTGAYSTPLFNIVPGSALGQGFWGLNGSLLFVHRYDPITVFWGGGYRHLFERQFNGVSFQAGEQVNYQFGMAFSVNDRVTLSATMLGLYVSEIRQGGTHLLGTNVEPISMRFAATIDRCGRILEPFCSLGVTEFAPAASLGISMTYR
jgi:hypothetical protein